MPQFHFVEDYERHVADLKRNYPIDEAMSLAIGGEFEKVGTIIANIILYAGLKNGMSVLDFGCGSGRLAKALSKRVDLSYVGLDVVQDLLDYAKTVSPKNYKFHMSRSYKVPLLDNSVHFALAFSVFTHLLHEETFIYLEEFRRVLKPKGIVLFSFLEFHLPIHFPIFLNMVQCQRASSQRHLDMFIERNQIQAWADHLGFEVLEFLDGDKGVPGNQGLGQSVAVLRAMS